MAYAHTGTFSNRPAEDLADSLLHDEPGELTRACEHICWDGCLFPNAEMMKQQTWNDILAAMIRVRDAHGWVQ